MVQLLGVDPDQPEGMIATSAKLNLNMKDSSDSPKQKGPKKKKKISETEKKLMNRLARLPSEFVPLLLIIDNCCIVSVHSPSLFFQSKQIL